MSLSNGPNLGLLINGNAGEAHYEAIMRQWRGLDLLVQPRVLDKDLAAPPGSPADGDAYIVAASPTGAWVGHAGELARYYSVGTTPGWEFFAPKSGWQVYVVDESAAYRYASGAWASVSSGSSRVGQQFEKEFALSDLVTAITTGTVKNYWRPTFSATDVTFQIMLKPGGESSSGVVTVDQNKNGSTMTSVAATIDLSEGNSSTGTAPTMAVTTFSAGDVITWDIDAAGTGAKGLQVVVLGKYA